MKNVRCPHGYTYNRTTTQCDPTPKVRGKEVRPIGSGKGKGVNASSLADVDIVAQRMQRERIPGTNQPKWWIFPTSGHCASYGNMCDPSCPDGAFTVGWCSSNCVAWGTDEQIEEQCGEDYGSCSGRVICFQRNMTH